MTSPQTFDAGGFIVVPDAVGLHVINSNEGGQQQEEDEGNVDFEDGLGVQTHHMEESGWTVQSIG